MKMSSKKHLGIMQPYFFPYLGYFQLINESKKFILYDKVSFRKESWITRNRILEKGSGLTSMIQMPSKNKSSYKLISEMQIDESKSWRKKILNQLFLSYKKSAHFDEVYPMLESCINNKNSMIQEYNSELIKKICTYLEIDTDIVCDNNYATDIERNLEMRATKNQLHKKTQRVIDLCKFHDMQNYLNPINGTDLYSKEDFKRMGYTLNFIEMSVFNYEQFNHPFTSHLSIIDVLFHLGKSGTISILNQFKIH